MPPVLTPEAMHEMRKVILGWPYKRFSQAVRVSAAQLCEYETGIGNLRRDQLETCERVLMKAVRDQGSRIARVTGGRTGGREQGRDAVTV